jgi:hypothetical protein
MGSKPSTAKEGNFFTKHVVGTAGIQTQIKEQGDRYFDLLDPWFNQEDGKLQSNIDEVHGTAKLIGIGLSFTSATIALAAVTNVITGIRAQKALNKFYAQVGHDVHAISEAMQALVSHKEQHEFATHVLQYVQMRNRELAIEERASKTPHYIFVFNGGDEWHPAFTELLESKYGRPADTVCSTWLSIITALLVSLCMALMSCFSRAPIQVPVTPDLESTHPRLLGIFNNIEVMSNYMSIIRKHVGSKAVFHILMPASSLTVLPDPMALAPELHPLRLEGLICNTTKMPYNHVNMPGARADMFVNVVNTADPPPAKAGTTWGRALAAEAAALGAGVGGGVAGAGGTFLAAALTVGFMAAPPVGLLVGAWVAVAGAGAAAGTASALSAKNDVKTGFEKKDRVEEVERVKAINVAAR